MPPKKAGSFGDISAITCVTAHRRPPSSSDDWHASAVRHRLSAARHPACAGVAGPPVTEKLLPDAVPVLETIREHNPLLFDFRPQAHAARMGPTVYCGIFEGRGPLPENPMSSQFGCAPRTLPPLLPDQPSSGAFNDNREQRW